MTAIFIAIAYMIGANLCYWMLRVEHESEKEVYTKGQQVLVVLLSILSWVSVFIVLGRAWYMAIGKTGYWSRPVKEVHEPVKPTE